MIKKLIGNTPLINIDGIWCKCEFMNLTGSIKDRVAYEMLSHVNTTAFHQVIEVTSGNTGISIAALSSWFGLKSTIICPSTISKNKINLMKKYGAEIILIDGNISNCMEVAFNIKVLNQGYYFLNQFENYYNTKAQEKMALEINEQLYKMTDFSKTTHDGYLPNAIVTGIGTGGTLAGLYNGFPNAQFYTWICNKPIEGTSDGISLPLKPRDCELIEIKIEYKKVLAAQNHLAKKGIFVGLSSATNFYLAKTLKGMFPHKNILTILVDRGERYL
jgi:cysteine synthase A